MRPIDDEVVAIAQAAVDGLTADERLQGSLGARGYVPLLEWASDRSLAAAAGIDGAVDAEDAAGQVHSLLRRLVQASVWAAERSDAHLIVVELKSCPPSVVARQQAVRALLRSRLGDDVDANAEAIAAALGASAPDDNH